MTTFTEPERITSGSYPTPEPLTIDEVSAILAERGYFAFRCDEAPITDKRIELVLDGGVWGQLVPCVECSGSGVLHQPWFLDTPENRARHFDEPQEEPIDV